MRNLEINFNGKIYLKMIEITFKDAKYQMASSIDPHEFEPKFFRTEESNGVRQYIEADQDVQKELKQIYWDEPSEIIY